MKNIHVKVVVLCLAIGCGVSLAQIIPQGDAYINTATPTTNYGTSTTLAVNGTTETAYIQFNLSSIPSGYTGSNIEKATLKLYVTERPRSCGSPNSTSQFEPRSERRLSAKFFRAP